MKGNEGVREVPRRIRYTIYFTCKFVFGNLENNAINKCNENLFPCEIRSRAELGHHVYRDLAADQSWRDPLTHNRNKRTSIFAFSHFIDNDVKHRHQ